jgi:SAM-dependent methyltransferase
MIALEKISKPESVSMHDDWFDIADVGHFWMQWRFEALQKSKHLLPTKNQKMFEIGCGNGIAVDQFENTLGCIVDGCDLNEHALTMSRPSNGRKLLYNIFELNDTLIKKYDSVLLLDILEHITDHVDFLKVASMYCKPGGTIIINVPAYQWLYSDYDKAVGHVRRYSSKEMKKLILAAGLVPVKSYYWGALLIPVAMIRKLVIAGKDVDIIKSGFKPPGKIADMFLRTLKAIENCLPFTLPFGTSLIAICKVKDN